MDKIKNQDNEKPLTYAGLDKKSADQFIKLSKFILSFFLIIQIILIGGIYKGEKLIANAKGEVFQITDFFTSTSFISVTLIVSMIIIYVFTRIFWYAILIGTILLLETISDFSKNLQDGFNYEDLEVFMSLTSVSATTALAAAFCMHAIKEIEKHSVRHSI